MKHTFRDYMPATLKAVPLLGGAFVMLNKM